MADKLMCISNDDTQKYPSVDYNDRWKRLNTQQIKWNNKSIFTESNFNKSPQSCSANEKENDIIKLRD